MIASPGLFEAHLTVVHLERAMKFYGELLGLKLATQIDEPRVAFYRLGGRGKTMLGLLPEKPRPHLGVVPWSQWKTVSR